MSNFIKSLKLVFHVNFNVYSLQIKRENPGKYIIPKLH